ncbi:TonB-dependent receptor [Galbibacter pacificus]|uniref:TonB-dependent receptor n=1 Tax=Galbibacter pacificus TaxID=2996052 RepID=A0ABT6FRD2_9FLAO|nr:TonB-dependent receptor [Galbibacter pacificus]MDG3581844.1 TonB-dependent receptor [Galbibacter pacificus]MDG3585682.1 TonB-dependent receptor [Galbibacter pacificus]
MKVTSAVYLKKANGILRTIYLSMKSGIQTVITKQNLLLGVLFLSTVGANSQATVEGKVHENNGIPVSFANVYLEGTMNGASTDTLGIFSFDTSERGIKKLVVSSMGYQNYESEIDLDKSPIKLDIVLKIDASQLGEVILSAGSFAAGDKAKGTHMNRIDVVTTAGSNGDVANAIKALPGAQQVGEQEGLFIRGGSGDEAKQFIDGTLFKNPNFSSVPGIIQPARLSPFLFKGITFSSGGYSALYGDALSGALILESMDLPEKSSALIGISPIVGTAGFDHLAKNNKSSYGASARYVNLAWYSDIIEQKPDYFHGPEYATADGNFRIKTSETGLLKFYGVVNYNNIGFRNLDIDDPNLKSSFQVEGKNGYGNLSYREFFNEDWKIDLGTTYNYNNDIMTRKLLNHDNEQVFLTGEPYAHKNTNLTTKTNFANTKAVVTRFLGNHSLKLGAELFYENNKYSTNDTLTSLSGNETAAFAEADISIAPNIAARAGVRYERSSLLDISNFAPRVSLAYRFNNGGQVNLAYGLFYQKPDYGELLMSRNNGIEYDVSLDDYKKLEYTKASHYILNYTRKANMRWFRAEVFYKKYNDLIKTVPKLFNNGEGYAKGIELFYRDKKTIRGLDYWISYTYLDTKRNYLDYPTSLHPEFSTPHTASVVAKRFFEGINTSVNAAYYFATGRPYYNFGYTHGTDATEILDQGTAKSYHSLNLSISYMTSLFKNWKHKDFTVIAFGVNNVLGIKQVFGYDYSADGTNKVPTTLPAPRSFFGGIFITFGIDRTQDFIDNNL